MSADPPPRLPSLTILRALVLAALFTSPACVDSAVTGAFNPFGSDVRSLGDVDDDISAGDVSDAGDVDVDVDVDVDAPDAPDSDTPDATLDADSSQDTTVIGCQSDDECTLGFGNIAPCDRAFCDPNTNTCAFDRVADCCETANDCPQVGAACLSFECPVPGESCVAVDLCPPCQFDDQCQALAPPCTSGRCSESQCFFEPMDNCCTAADQCDDADSCTSDQCDQGGVCGFIDNAQAGCCTTPPVVDSEFSPPPAAMRLRGNADDAGWQLIDAPFAPTPPAALYMGNTNTYSTASAQGRYNARAIFRVNDVPASSTIETKLILKVDLRPGADADAFAINLRRVTEDAANAETHVLYRKGDGPLAQWHPLKFTTEIAGGGVWQLELRYNTVDNGPGPNDATFGILIDNLSVRTACGLTPTCDDDQCVSDDPCLQGFCDAAGQCQFAPLDGCCTADSQCPAQGPCAVGRCDNNSCTTASAPNCCTSDAECPPSPDACHLASICDSSGQCRLTETAINCDDGDPCTADACDPQTGQCASTAIPGCCQGPDCQCVDGPVVSYDFESNAQGWVFTGAQQGFGWLRAQVALNGVSTVIGFGNFATQQGDPGFPMTADATSGPIALPAGATELRVSFDYFIALQGEEADAVRLEVLSAMNTIPVLWELGLNTPRFSLESGAATLPAALAGQSIILRLVYMSNDSNQAFGPGLMFDNIVISASCDATSCSTNADCPAGPPCTGAFCAAGTCGLVDIVCDDGDICTTDSCDPITGQCRFVADPLGAPGCSECTSDGDCSDGGACTSDFCDDAGTCQSSPIPGCCDRDSDCSDQDSCTSDFCVPGFGICINQPIAGCCDSDGACDDNDPCTRDECTDSGCLNTADSALPGCDGGCQSDGQCDDGDSCTVNLCDLQSGQCLALPIPGCCASGADCDDGDACTIDACSGGACSYTDAPGLPGCGGCDGDASCDDNNACTLDRCGSDGQCTNVASGACCQADSDCDDGDVCTQNACDLQTGQCAAVPIEGCCTGPFQCGDGDICTVDRCVDNRCNHQQLTILGCGPQCSAQSECDDGNACTNDACNNGTCRNLPIPGCCDSDADCSDGDLCTSDNCVVAGLCINSPISCNDGDACTADSCDPQLGCVNAVIAGCCLVGSDCDDGDSCTQDACGPDGRCSHAAIADCCAAGGNGTSCDDGDACTADSCGSDGQCDNATIAGCCTADSQCVSGDTCTSGSCDLGAHRCVFTASDDADCCEPEAVVLWSFPGGDTGSDWAVSPAPSGAAVTWWVSNRRAYSSPNALYMGNPITGNYDNGGVPAAYATSPAVTLPDAVGVEMSFRVWLDIEGFEEFDPFFIDVIGDSGEVINIWDKTAVPTQSYSSWVLSKISLSSFAGQTIRVRFRFEADDNLLNSTEGIFVDDIMIRAVCEAVTICGSDFECDDGQACTQDRCVAGACQADPIAGCCDSANANACDDQYACTTDACVDGACSNALIAGCCTVDAECRDGKACTVDSCDAATHTCRNVDNGDCCETAQDCSDGDACSLDICQPNGGCRYAPNLGAPDCCTAEALFSDHFSVSVFDKFHPITDGSDVRWRIHNGRTADAPFALYYGNPAAGNYDSGARTFGDATSDPVAIPVTAHDLRLDFWVWIDVEDYPFEDLLSARVLVGGQSFAVWERSDLGFGEARRWVPVTIGLPSALAGRTARIRFAFDSVDDFGNQGEGVYIDGVELYSVCAP